MRRASSSALVLLLGVLATPGSAVADSTISRSAGALLFLSEDAGVGNRLTIDVASGNRIRFADDADPFGINYPDPPCSPGRINGGGNVVEVFCRREGYTRVVLQMGAGEDQVVADVPDIPFVLEGQVGADRLRGGGAADRVVGGQGNDALDGATGNDIVQGDDGDDQLAGGAGDDQVTGGPGTDVYAGGAGSDTLRSADGIAETVDCGEGDDTAEVDQLDQPVGCEKVTRRDVAAVAGAAPADTRAPVLQLGGSTLQRVGAQRRRLTVALNVTEVARVDVSGFLAAGGINTRVTPVSGSVTVAGGGTRLRVTLSAAQTRRVLADLRRRRRPTVQLTATAVDAAGNTSRPRRLTVRLRR